MKNMIIPFLLVLSAVFSLSSCGCEPDTLPDEIAGEWHLSNINGGIAGANIDYKRGEFVCSFNDDDKKLTVEKNIISTGPESISTPLESGTYIYESTEEGTYYRLNVENHFRGVYRIQNDSLLIDDGVDADGFFYIFIR